MSSQNIMGNNEIWQLQESCTCKVWQGKFKIDKVNRKIVLISLPSFDHFLLEFNENMGHDLERLAPANV